MALCRTTMTCPLYSTLLSPSSRAPPMCSWWVGVRATMRVRLRLLVPPPVLPSPASLLPLLPATPILTLRSAGADKRACHLVVACDCAVVEALPTGRSAQGEVPPVGMRVLIAGCGACGTADRQPAADPPPPTHTHTFDTLWHPHSSPLTHTRAPSSTGRVCPDAHWTPASAVHHQRDRACV
jgi:hypothetical protein